MTTETHSQPIPIVGRESPRTMTTETHSQPIPIVGRESPRTMTTETHSQPIPIVGRESPRTMTTETHSQPKPIVGRESPPIHFDSPHTRTKAFEGDQQTSVKDRQIFVETSHFSLVNQHSGQDSDVNHFKYYSIERQGDGDDTKARFKFFEAPRRKKIVLVLCVSAMFLSQCAGSVLAPFYPLEAENKGMSLTMIGFVFGVYQLIVFITSPFMGSVMTKIGVKFIYLSGIFVGGSCIILFGLLNKVPAGSIFICMSMLVRCVEAMGFAGFMTASMTIIASEFSDHIGMTMGFLKSAVGLGHMVGPVLAGFLYELGGYGMPFYVLGAVILLNGISVYTFLQPDGSRSKSGTFDKGSFLHLLRGSMIWFSLIIAYFSMVSVAMAITTLANRLEIFDLSQAAVGGMFCVGSFVILIMTPVWGYITDVKDKQASLVIFGHFIGCVSWLLLGPSWLVPFIPDNLWCIGVGLVLLGLSIGCITVTSMKCAIKGALELGYENDVETCAFVLGLQNAASALGGFTGPVMAGGLVQDYGFPTGFTVIALVNLALGFLSVGYFHFRYFMRNRT